jgi:hypothetical protein
VTPQELLAKVERQKRERLALAALWESLFPSCPTPDDRQFIIWLNLYGFDVTVAGIERALVQQQRRQQKFDEAARECLAGTASGIGPCAPSVPEPMDCDDIVRYASGVMKGIKSGVRPFGEAEEK